MSTTPPLPTIPSEDRHARTWTIVSVAAFCAFSCLAPLLAIWGIQHDMEQIRTTLLQAETGRIRSHAVRTVGNIQDQMHKAETIDLAELIESDYPRSNWQKFLRNDASRLYAAVLDPTGKVVIHFHPEQEGLSLKQPWYKRVVFDDVDDVVETDDEALTKGRVAYDVQLPIFINDQIVGYYHSGLDRDWLEQQIGQKESLAQSVWTWLLLAMLVFEIVAGLALFYTSRRIAILQEATKVGRTRRFAEIGQLMAGIVHEIRNPLNAMRLNLHVLNRTDEEGGPADLEKWDIDRGALIQETKAEIERVEGLLRILLGYARPDVPRPEILDLRQEIHSTLTFLRPLLERREMLVVARLTDSTVKVEMDRDRFRQVLLNLLNNACDAMHSGGTVSIEMKHAAGMVELRVADDGIGVPPSMRERIFEPFYSTKETGTGLGLAIVRRHIEDAGGEVHCEPRADSGSVFVIRLPAAFDAPIETAPRTHA
ncbi:MAG: ATP-binding protein [Pirellulales bacterium]